MIDSSTLIPEAVILLVVAERLTETESSRGGTGFEPVEWRGRGSPPLEDTGWKPKGQDFRPSYLLNLGILIPINISFLRI